MNKQLKKAKIKANKKIFLVLMKVKCPLAWATFCDKLSFSWVFQNTQVVITQDISWKILVYTISSVIRYRFY